jgi:hypothetical protein
MKTIKASTHLSDSEVAAIRARYTRGTPGRPRLNTLGVQQGSKAQLAAEYGISRSMVGWIISGRRRVLPE